MVIFHDPMLLKGCDDKIFSYVVTHVMCPYIEKHSRKNFLEKPYHIKCYFVTSTINARFCIHFLE